MSFASDGTGTPTASQWRTYSTRYRLTNGSCRMLSTDGRASGSLDSICDSRRMTSAQTHREMEKEEERERERERSVGAYHVQPLPVDIHTWR
jgi:hypothetical protein